MMAALKAIELLERDKVLENIWEKGERFMKNIRKLLDTYEVGAELTGIAPMFYITFKKDGAPTKGNVRTFTPNSFQRGFSSPLLPRLYQLSAY